MSGWGGDAERRYTLDEAQRELARRECATVGHNLDIIEEAGVGPVEVLCVRCSASWKITGAPPDLGDTRQAVDAQPVLEFRFRGYPGKLTVQAVLTDELGRERLFAVPVQIEHRHGSPFMTLDLEALTGSLHQAIDEGTFGP